MPYVPRFEDVLFLEILKENNRFFMSMKTSWAIWIEANNEIQINLRFSDMDIFGEHHLKQLRNKNSLWKEET